MWYMIAEGKTIGELGSENGCILLDEEYKDRCSITLEKTEEYYAITCGVYGEFMHTTFAGEDDHLTKYNAMKHDLALFIDQDIHYPASEQFYDEFSNRY